MSNHKVIGTYDGQFENRFGDDGQFGITADSHDNICLVDCGNFRIQNFTNDGGFITKWGGYEPGDGRHRHLESPIDIGVDSNDRYYITDTKHHLVKNSIALVSEIIWDSDNA